MEPKQDGDMEQEMEEQRVIKGDENKENELLQGDVVDVRDNGTTTTAITAATACDKTRQNGAAGDTSILRGQNDEKEVVQEDEEADVESNINGEADDKPDQQLIDSTIGTNEEGRVTDHRGTNGQHQPDEVDPDVEQEVKTMKHSEDKSESEDLGGDTDQICMQSDGDLPIRVEAAYTDKLPSATSDDDDSPSKRRVSLPLSNDLNCDTSTDSPRTR